MSYVAALEDIEWGRTPVGVPPPVGECYSPYCSGVPPFTRDLHASLVRSRETRLPLADVVNGGVEAWWDSPRISHLWLWHSQRHGSVRYVGSTSTAVLVRRHQCHSTALSHVASEYTHAYFRRSTVRTTPTSNYNDFFTGLEPISLPWPTISHSSPGA